MSSDRIDFNDLLKWFINLTPEQQLDTAQSGESENRTNYVENTERKGMSAEDQEFLLSAMDSHVMDEQKRVKLLLKVMRLPQSPHTLHHLQEIEKITKHQQKQQIGPKSPSTASPDPDNTGFGVLNDKHKLRSLLEMRNEDKKRRELGEAVLGEEYIPSTFISEYETYKKSTLDIKLEQIRRKIQRGDQNDQEKGDQKDELAEVPAEALIVEEVDESGEPLSAEQIRRKKAQKRYQYLAQLIEDEIQTTFSSLLEQLPAPEQSTLKRVYNKVRDEKLDALEEIEDRTYRGDNAVGFVNYNGIQILTNYLLSQDFELASLCWRILGNIVANQAFCQNKAVEFGLVKVIIEGLNVTRYLPSIIAHHFFYNILPVYVEQLQAEHSSQPKQQELAEIQRLLLEFAPLCNLTTPRTHATNLTEEEYNCYLTQLFPPSPTSPTPSPVTLIPVLSKYTHFGVTYVKHIMPLLKSILFFTASLLNNYSTAQTQFLQHNGIISLSYLLELGALHLKSTASSPQLQSPKPTSPSTTPTTPTTAQSPHQPLPATSHPTILPPLLQLFDFNESVSNQTIRRVFQVLLGLVDDEYEITTSYELFGALFNQAKTYLRLQSHNPGQIGHSLESYTLTPLAQQPGFIALIAGQKHSAIVKMHEDVKNASSPSSLSSSPLLSSSTSLIEVVSDAAAPQGPQEVVKVATNANGATMSQIDENMTTTTPTPTTPTAPTTAEEEEDQDKGKPRSYFSQPLAPFRLEDSTEIHPSFKLQNNRAGGKINTTGEVIELQLPLHPVSSLLVLFAFPFSMWEVYFNAGGVDRDWVVNAQRVVAFCAKNHYKLKYFAESDQKCIDSAASGHNDVKGGGSSGSGGSSGGRNISTKFGTTLHDILIGQARVLAVNAQKSPPKSVQSVNGNGQDDLKDDQIISTVVIGFIDAHIKGLLAKVKGTKIQQDQQREFNREELQFLSQIKAGINK